MGTYLQDDGAPVSPLSPPWGFTPGAESFASDPGPAPFTDYADAPFDVELFYSFFPEFAGSTLYPESFIAAAAKQAAMFVKPTWCRELDGADRTYALNLTVAHMAVLIKRQQSSLAGTAEPAAAGSVGGLESGPGVVTSASVGGVSVSKGMMMQPKNNWEEYFYQTPYGRTLLAFLGQKTACGFLYEGGENIADCLRD